MERNECDKDIVIEEKVMNENREWREEKKEIKVDV